MSLFEEFVEKNEEYREAGNYYPDHSDIASALDAEFVHFDIVDTTRWGQVVEYVYGRGGEYVKVIYEDGSGDSEIDYEPEIQEVFRVTKTVVDFIPAAKPLPA